MKSKNPFRYHHTLPAVVWENWDPDVNGLFWCSAQWGPGGFGKDSHWYYSGGEEEGDDLCFHFRYEQDAIMFILTWS